jgi:hypothetical protein
MAHMKKIKTSIGKDDLVSSRAPLAHQLSKFSG